jgi:hypothetical protein
MTQLLQRNAQGVPSILQTFLVRIAALGLGVLIALSVNFLFSIIYYRKIGKKRLEFVKLQGVAGLKKSYEVLSQSSGYPVSQSILAGVFNDIEMVKANLETMMKENKLPFNRNEKKNLDCLYEMVKRIKTIIHLAYDCIFINEEFKVSLDQQELNRFAIIVDRLATMDFTDKRRMHARRIEIPSSDAVDGHATEATLRFRNNLSLMEDQFNQLISLSETLR